MAKRYACDFCGEPITDETLMVKIAAQGHEYNPDNSFGDNWVYGEVGHYHATEDWSCWAEMLDRIALIHDVSSEIGLRPADLERSQARRVERQREEEERQHKEEERARRHEEYYARKRAWRDTPQEARETLMRESLGDDQLLLSELAARMTAKLWGEDPPFRLYDSSIRTAAIRMLEAGRVERVPETFRNQRRYRWRRKRLDGTLEVRAYNDDDGLLA